MQRFSIRLYLEGFTLSKTRRFTIRSKIVLGYLVVVLLFGVVLLILSAQIDVLQKENDFISHHDLDVHNLTNAIEKNVLDMETGQRGFMLTGKESYLQPYDQGLSEWNTNYDQLYALISDNPAQQQNLQNIKSHINRWIEIAGERSVQLKKEGDQDKVLAFSVRSGENGNRSASLPAGYLPQHRNFAYRS